MKNPLIDTVKHEHKSLEDYSEWLIRFVGAGDTIKCVDGEEYWDEWEGDEVIVLRGYAGTLLGLYNKDKEIELKF